MHTPQDETAEMGRITKNDSQHSTAIAFKYLATPKGDIHTNIYHRVSHMNHLVIADEALENCAFWKSRANRC